MLDRILKEIRQHEVFCCEDLPNHPIVPHRLSYPKIEESRESCRAKIHSEIHKLDYFSRKVVTTDPRQLNTGYAVTILYTGHTNSHPQILSSRE